jgi:hypothetical protein
MATRYQRGYQNLYIEGQTTQWPQDTKGGNQNLYIEGQTTQWPQDTKGVIRICI